MYDLTCVVPLYGANCEDVSLRMVSSLAIQNTNYSVKYMFYYDDTVSRKAIAQIDSLFQIHNKDYDIVYCEKSCSGYKRNKGLEYAVENSKYVWFIDQDDYLMSEYAISLILEYPLIYNLPILRINFEIPELVNEENKKYIYGTITMPWIYIFRTDLIKKYRFGEDSEYGSDIPVTIEFLLDNGYYKFYENDIKLECIKNISYIRGKLYFYNYLNANSYMYKHAVNEGNIKDGEVDEAVNMLIKLRDRDYEDN